MKTIRFILPVFFFLTYNFQSFGQINPIENLTWSAWYEFPNNYFSLDWNEPEAPHDEIIGYNVYRESELYRFQIERSLYNLEEGSNCEEDFLYFNEGQPFYAHVTAVYVGDIESGYTESVYVEGIVLNTNDYKEQKAIVYPNPTKGILNIQNKNIQNILVFDFTGKLIKEYTSKTQINLSNISKGVYIIKLISEKGVLENKIILQ